MTESTLFELSLLVKGVFGGTQAAALWTRGVGRNGKDTLCNIMQAVLGSYAVSMAAQTLSRIRDPSAPSPAYALCRARRFVATNASPSGSSCTRCSPTRRVLPAAPGRCRGRAVVGHLQLAPARPVLRQEEIVREVRGVGHGERVGGEELRRGDRARARHVAADRAARRHSAARGREGAAQALAVQRPVMVSVAPVSAPVAAKLAAVAAPEAVSVPVDTSPTVVKFPALAVLLMVRVLPVIPVAELSRPTLAAPLMLSELPDTAPVDVSAAPATAPVAVSAAQETAPEASTPVVNTSVQFTSLHSSWSQPTLPCAVSPSSVAEPVRASESASKSVTGTDSPSKALALICTLYRSSVPADCCTSPKNGQLRDSARRHREVQARRAPDALRGRAEEGAGDAHVVVVGRADVHHQVGGRAQPVPAAEGVASPRRQRVGAHDVPGEGAQGHGVALQLEASRREAGQGHGALAVGAHQKIS